MPLIRRRPLLRAAAVGGGAYMYGKHRAVEQEQMQEQAFHEGQRSAAAAPAPAFAPTPAPAAGVSSDDLARLRELADLHEQGALTDEEFSRQKTLVLGAG